MSQWHFYEPAAGHRLPHDPFKAIVAPRPIGWISTLDADGRPNLAPYSFFNAVCDAPPMVMFSSSAPKDTQANVDATGEFVVNLATRALAEAMNTSSAAVPYGVDEFALAGLDTLPSQIVRPRRVARSPAALECRLVHVLPLRTLEGAPTASTVFVGQVVGVHLDMACLRDGRFDMTVAGTIARCGYRGGYTQVTELFEILRPAGVTSSGASG
ncbi:MAG: flavin reductase family protein [Acidobacteria bacterium]|nr:flavin reductase family protein [Acidobacteriota bacterium]